MTEKLDLIRIYLSLENKTNDLGLIIHFDEKNFDTFGIEVYNLFFLSCNLFERLAKKICNDNKSKMDTWKQDEKIRKCSDNELTFIPMNYKFKPMEALGNEKIKDRLTWWDDYNLVKHNLSEINKATLHNLIYALSSTGLLLPYVTSPEYSPDNPSKLFGGMYIPDDGFYNSSINVTVVGETEDSMIRKSQL